MERKHCQDPYIPISNTKRPELDLLDPVSPTSLKAAKPPSEGHHDDVRYYNYIISLLTNNN